MMLGSEVLMSFLSPPLSSLDMVCRDTGLINSSAQVWRQIENVSLLVQSVVLDNHGTSLKTGIPFSRILGLLRIVEVTCD